MPDSPPPKDAVPLAARRRAEQPDPVKNHPCGVCQAGPNGVADDHPMIHIGPNYDWVVSRGPAGEPLSVVRNPSFHFDCLPQEFVGMLMDAHGYPHPQHIVTVAARQAALDGAHGRDLDNYITDFISETGGDNDVDPPPPPKPKTSPYEAGA